MQRYQILSTLGDGSFGTVYKARCQRTGDVVAVKHIKRRFSSWQECLGLREVASLTKLRHEYIVKLRELIFEKEDGQLYFVFEYAHGNLYEVLQHRKSLASAAHAGAGSRTSVAMLSGLHPPPQGFGAFAAGSGVLPSGFTEDEVRVIIGQVLRSLAHMHKHGFFHRDVKPENLLMMLSAPSSSSSSSGYSSARSVAESYEGIAVAGYDTSKAGGGAPAPPGSIMVFKLCDFGQARETRSRPPYTSYVSTRWYRAPEVILGSQNYNSPIDVWAAGCIMAELYSGKPLFPGTSALNQAFCIVNTLGPPTAASWAEGARLCQQMGIRLPPPTPSKLAASVPGACEAALEAMTAMLHWDPAKRPSAADVLAMPFFRGFNAWAEEREAAAAAAAAPTGGAGAGAVSSVSNRSISIGGPSSGSASGRGVGAVGAMLISGGLGGGGGDVYGVNGLGIPGSRRASDPFVGGAVAGGVDGPVSGRIGGHGGGSVGSGAAAGSSSSGGSGWPSRSSGATTGRGWGGSEGEEAGGWVAGDAAPTAAASAGHPGGGGGDSLDATLEALGIGVDSFGRSPLPATRSQARMVGAPAPAGPAPAADLTDVDAFLANAGISSGGGGGSSSAVSSPTGGAGHAARSPGGVSQGVASAAVSPVAATRHAAPAPADVDSLLASEGVVLSPQSHLPPPEPMIRDRTLLAQMNGGAGGHGAAQAAAGDAGASGGGFFSNLFSGFRRSRSKAAPSGARQPVDRGAISGPRSQSQPPTLTPPASPHGGHRREGAGAGRVGPAPVPAPAAAPVPTARPPVYTYGLPSADAVVARTAAAPAAATMQPAAALPAGQQTPVRGRDPAKAGGRGGRGGGGDDLEALALSPLLREVERSLGISGGTSTSGASAASTSTGFTGGSHAAAPSAHAAAKPGAGHAAGATGPAGASVDDLLAELGDM